MTSAMEILRRERERQIAIHEGRDAGEPVERPESRVHVPPKRKKARFRLTFSPHALRRMAQRNINASQVYAIYRFGDVKSQGERTMYHASDRAICEATASGAEILRTCRGAAIVVVPAARLVVTVIASGEDTNIWGDDR